MLSWQKAPRAPRQRYDTAAGSDGYTAGTTSLLLGVYGDVDEASWKALTRTLGGPDGMAEWKAAGSPARIASVRRDRRALATRGHLAGVATSDGDRSCGELLETVLEAYAHAGIVGLAAQRAEFTCVIWDGQEQALIVACGAMGFGAPAYAWDGQTFAVCSKAMPLLGLRNVSRDWNHVYLAHVLSGLWAPAASTSAFRGLRRMVGGDILRVSIRGLECHRGAILDFEPRAGLRRERVVDELAQRIDRAVRAQLSQPGRTCVALSAGLDSCVVASAVARYVPNFDAFRLIAREALVPAPASLQAVFPAIKEHWVAIPNGLSADANAPLEDDPMAAGPAMQPARAALLRAVSDAGFDRILDGEGGDELFDLAWRLGDIADERVSLATARVLLRHPSRGRFLRDLLARGAMGCISSAWLRRQRVHIAARRPWLTSSFWNGHAFGAAWEEALDFAAKRHARDRLAQVLEGHARYRAALAVIRENLDIEGASPLLDRNVVEYVGALPARLAVDPQHRKALLRRVAATRLPAAVAWRPKQEPLYEWLATRAVCDESRVDRITRAVATSALLRENIDPLAVRAAVDAVRRSPEGTTSMTVALDQLFWFVEWCAAVHALYGL
jgi:asparagine synthetase B (glutamine-hydrolysing)